MNKLVMCMAAILVSGTAFAQVGTTLKEGAKASEDDEKDEPKGPPKAIESGTDSGTTQSRRDETTA